MKWARLVTPAFKEVMNSVEVRPQKSPWVGQKNQCLYPECLVGYCLVPWDLGICLPMSGPVRVQKSSGLRQNRPVNTNIVSRAGALWFGQCFSADIPGFWVPKSIKTLNIWSIYLHRWGSYTKNLPLTHQQDGNHTGEDHHRPPHPQAIPALSQWRWWANIKNTLRIRDIRGSLSNFEWEHMVFGKKHVKDARVTSLHLSVHKLSTGPGWLKCYGWL